MSTLAETRKSLLEIINEVRRKLGINTVTSLDADQESRIMVQYLNDVIDEISDYGNWQEMLATVLVTASSSIRTYTVSATSPVKSIREVAFADQIAPLRYREIEDLRRWSRIGGTGVPRNYSVIGVDNTTGNPKIEVYPVPSSAENNSAFNVLYYRKPILFSASSSADYVPEFPSRMLVAGLVAKMYEDETARQQDYAIARATFERVMAETFNRYNGDTGQDTRFVPFRMRQR